MRRRVVTDGDLVRIADLRERGWSFGRIRAALGSRISESAISWHCLRLGADPPRARVLPDKIVGPAVVSRGGHLVRRFTPAEDARILALAAEGKGCGTIARLIGRRSNSVVGRLMTLARREARREAAA